MEKLIDAGALLDACGPKPICTRDGADELQALVDWRRYTKLIRRAPAVDPVRAAGGCCCRECGHWGGPEGENRCKKFSVPPIRYVQTKADDFCRWGIRKESEEWPNAAGSAQ